MSERVGHFHDMAWLLLVSECAQPSNCILFCFANLVMHCRHLPLSTLYGDNAGLTSCPLLLINSYTALRPTIRLRQGLKKRKRHINILLILQRRSDCIESTCDVSLSDNLEIPKGVQQFNGRLNSFNLG